MDKKSKFVERVEVAVKTPKKGAPALSFAERKDMNKLQKEIEKITLQIEEIDLKILNAGSKEGYSVLAEWSAQASALRSSLDDKELKWMELAERDS